MKTAWKLEMGSKVAARISICHAIPWGRPFSLCYPEFNIPHFRDLVPAKPSQGLSIVFYRFLDGCKTMPILQNINKTRHYGLQ